MKDYFDKRHRDDEGFDRITIEVVPRFKTSGLSGDEWRVSSVIRFYRKGVQVFERGFSSMENAVRFLPWVEAVEAKEQNSAWPIKGDELKCFQPGCAELATVEYQLKKEYSDQGEGPLPADKTWKMRRRFCKAHAHRGDCGLEDADENYEIIKGGESSLKDVPQDRISPSAFGGVVELDPE